MRFRVRAATVSITYLCPFPEDYPTKCVAYHTTSSRAVVKMESSVSVLRPSFTLRRLIKEIS